MVCFWISVIRSDQILNSVSWWAEFSVNTIHSGSDSGYVLWLSTYCSHPSVIHSWFSVYMRQAAEIGLPAGTWGPQTPSEANDRFWDVAVQNVAEPLPPPFWCTTRISPFFQCQYLIYIVDIYSNLKLVIYRQQIGIIVSCHHKQTLCHNYLCVALCLLGLRSAYMILKLWPQFLLINY